jgi:hypothetical protein
LLGIPLVIGETAEFRIDERVFHVQHGISLRSGGRGRRLDRVRTAPADLHVFGGAGMIHRQRNVIRDRRPLCLNPAEHAIDEVRPAPALRPPRLPRVI